MKIKIKPLSANKMRQKGRKKSFEYLKRQEIVLKMLPPLKISKDKIYRVEVTFFFSSAGADIDNPAKPFLDCLSKRFGFNDNQIYQLYITKKIVEKGKEYIDFEFYELIDFKTKV